MRQYCRGFCSYDLLDSLATFGVLGYWVRRTGIGYCWYLGSRIPHPRLLLQRRPCKDSIMHCLFSASGFQKNNSSLAFINETRNKHCTRYLLPAARAQQIIHRPRMICRTTALVAGRLVGILSPSVILTFIIQIPKAGNHINGPRGISRTHYSDANSHSFTLNNLNHPITPQRSARPRRGEVGD